jgi:putative transposase
MYKPRLQRLKWLFTDRPLFFITTTTHRRRRLLDQSPVHQAFLAFAEKAAARGVFAGRYVLMPDHLHCFVAVAPEGLSLSKWVQILKVTLAKPLRGQGHEGPFWQKGFFDHVLRSGESYSREWEYVRRNPVEAGFVKEPEEWPFQGEVFRLGWDL